MSLIRTSNHGITRFIQPRESLDESELLEMAGMCGWWNLPPLLQEPAMQAVMNLKRAEGVGRVQSLKLRSFRDGKNTI